jgi:hypothetical protein
MSVILTKAGVAVYRLSDGVPVTLSAASATIGTGAAAFIVWDVNASNGEVFEKVANVPDDFAGDTYRFDGTTWASI